ncbi:DNA repair protein RecO [Pelagibacteraceae bacterium]|nr:DNA repair protein RecO [Pelagibacteraceae bacterium]
MNWQDEGFLLSKIKFRENANIINVFTNSHGKVSGIVYGGNSRKIRNFLQISNKIFVFYNAKSENRIGYFKTELVEAISPKYFNNKKKTTSLLSLSSILNLLLPDSQPYKNLFISVENFLKSLDQDNWALNYIYLELSLLKELGFDPYLEQFNKNLDVTSEYKTIEIDNIKYQVPIFLLKRTNKITISNKNLSTALSFTRNLLSNKFFLPNNLIFPKARIILENYFN